MHTLRRFAWSPFLSLLLFLPLLLPTAAAAQTWEADLGNGTYSNPLFYDEFSDPDLIRVGDWFYMTGTTMHAVPGLPVLRSRDLVNWEFVSYAMPSFPEGPEYRLEDGKDMYGQGIWAPVLRHHAGRFHIFANINGRGLQVFTATDPAGPWTHTKIDRNLHDLSVLFDDDGRVWAVFDYNEVRLVELKADLSGVVDDATTAWLAVVQVAIETAFYLALAAGVARAGAWFRTPRVRRRVEAVSGTVLVGLGIRVAASSR